jgi:heat shock protein HslJ
MKTILQFIILGAISLSQFLSCNSSTSSINPENSKAINLLGHKWELYSFRSENGSIINLNPDETYEIVFAQNDTLSGIADCNSYHCEFTAKDGGNIKIDLIHMTEIYCGEESHDDKYYDALRSTSVYEVNSIMLKLGFGTKGVLQFIKK